MNIGYFTKTKEGNFSGSIVAIGGVFSQVTLEAVKAEGNDPNYRVTTLGVDLGAAWDKTSKRTGKSYVSVSLKSPFIPSQVYAALVETNESGEFALVWSEPKPKSNG